MVTQVVITRPRHPLHGESVQVLGRQRHRGAVQLLAVLPDGSKTLLPAAWTDLEPTVAAAEPAAGSLSDLLEAVALVAALLARGGQAREQTARQPPTKENHRAAHPTQSATRAGAGATRAAARPAARDPGRGRGRAAGPPARRRRDGVVEVTGDE